MAWKNRGDPFITAQGECQRQSNGGRNRFRIQVHGVGYPMWFRIDGLFDIAEFLDDLCDAIEDGEFEVMSREQELRSRG